MAQLHRGNMLAVINPESQLYLEVDVSELCFLNPKALNMKAARFHGTGDVRIEEIPKPEPAGHEVLIEIEWCGICGTGK